MTITPTAGVYLVDLSLLSDLSRLAGKQKRLKAWQNVADHSTIDRALKMRFFEHLKAYRNTLARAWKEGSCSPELLLEISTLERELEKLDEAARIVFVHR